MRDAENMHVNQLVMTACGKATKMNFNNEKELINAEPR